MAPRLIRALVNSRTHSRIQGLRGQQPLGWRHGQLGPRAKANWDALRGAESRVRNQAMRSIK